MLILSSNYCSLHGGLSRPGEIAVHHLPENVKLIVASDRGKVRDAAC